MIIWRVKYIDPWCVRHRSHHLSHRAALNFTTEITRAYREIREKQDIAFDATGDYGGIPCPDPEAEIQPVEFAWTRAGVCRLLDDLAQDMASNEREKIRSRLL